MEILYILFAAIALGVFVTVFYFNRFVRLRNKVQEAWSGIDVQLKRRYNLVPNLVETIQSYAAHEKEVFTEVAQSRSQGIQADTTARQAQAESQLNSALNKLLAVAESYPELKSNQNFIEFQETLEEIEEKIQLARRYYNALVRDNNTSIQTFPGVMFAKSFGFNPFEYFEIENMEQRKHVEVKF